jgi:hypothetical protein
MQHALDNATMHNLWYTARQKLYFKHIVYRKFANKKHMRAWKNYTDNQI